MILQLKIPKFETILVALVLLILIQPELFTNGIINNCYKYGGIMVTLVLVLLVFVNTRIDVGFIWSILFFGTSFLITIMKNGYISEFLREQIGAFGLCCLFFLCIKTNTNLLIDAFSIMDIYIFINFITVLLHPYELYGKDANAYWFFGNGNYHIRMIIPIVAISVLRNFKAKEKIGMYHIILIVVSLFTCLLNDSATGVLTILLFTGLVFLFRPGNKNLPKWFTLNRCLLFTIIVDIAVVVFRLQYLFSFLIENILKKSITLTGRTFVWDKAIRCIMNKPWGGYGYLVGEAYQRLIWENHPHNYFMYILMTGGVILLIIVLLGFLIANNSLNISIESMTSKITLFTIVCFLFMGIDESITKTPLLYPFLLLAIESFNLNCDVSESGNGGLFKEDKFAEK